LSFYIPLFTLIRKSKVNEKRERGRGDEGRKGGREERRGEERRGEDEWMRG